VSVPSTTALTGKDGELAVAAKAVDEASIKARTAVIALLKFFMGDPPGCRYSSAKKDRIAEELLVSFGNPASRKLEGPWLCVFRFP
jgi:hypothetical protein